MLLKTLLWTLVFYSIYKLFFQNKPKKTVPPKNRNTNQTTIIKPKSKKKPKFEAETVDFEEIKDEN